MGNKVSSSGPGANSGSCSAANPCPDGTTCWECNCVPICSLNTPCPSGTTCQTVSNQFQTVTACLPPPLPYPPIPQAVGISEQYQAILANFPVVVVNWFVQNFGSVDLQVFGAPAPSCDGVKSWFPCAATRGSLNDLNISAEVQGHIDVLGGIDWYSESVTGIGSGYATIYPAPNASVTVPTYGPVSNVTTSWWNYETGSLNINTVIAFNIPNMKIYALTDLDSVECNYPEVYVDMQVLIPVTMTFVPGLSILYSINISPSLIVPWINDVQVNINNLSFTCNSFSPSAQVIDTYVKDHKQTAITNGIISGLPPVIKSLLQDTLFNNFNSAVQGLLVEYNILSPAGDVLITNPQQIAQLYIQYLAQHGTNPIVLAILNGLIQKGITSLEILLNWPVVTFACQSVTVPAVSGCVTYYRKTVQPYVGTPSTTQQMKSANKSANKSVNSKNLSKTSPSSVQSLDRRVAIPTGSTTFSTRQAASQYCANNVQKFQCSPQGLGCVPASSSANAQFVVDPNQPDAQADATMLQCTQQCIGRACGTSSFQCNTVDQCAFTEQQSELSGKELCDKSTLTDGSTCNNKCPSYILMANGSCVPAIGGQYYNDPNCGLPPTTQGACVIQADTSLCYDTFPSPALQTPAQGSPMTAQSCAALTQFTGIAAKFYPNKKCSSQVCTSPLQCPDSKASCIPAPAIPNSNGTQFYQDWLPASCPPPTCDNKTNPCPNGQACVSGPNGNVCGPCQQNSDCPPTAAGAPQICQAGQCVPAQAPPNATGSCYGSSFGAQYCYTTFPLPNDPTYTQGSAMTNDMCTYLGQVISGSQSSTMQFTPNGTCTSQCSSTTGQCTAPSSGGQNCLQFPTGDTTWTAAGCR